MNCPECSHETAVLDSRRLEEGGIIRRRRQCRRCKHRFTTYEVLASTYADAQMTPVPWSKLADAHSAIVALMAHQPAKPTV